MEKIFGYISGVACMIASFCFGEPSIILKALIGFMIFDYITGILVGIYHKNLSSKVGFKGIFKKCAILVVVSISHILDIAIFGGGTVVMSAVMAFYLANEGISILENACKMGIPIPNKIKNILEQLKEKENNYD